MNRVPFPYQFKNIMLFEKCFKTTSYGMEHNEEDYCQLEFYGDKLLESMLGTYLYKKHYSDVGTLSQKHAFIRSRHVLMFIYDLFYDQFEMPKVKFGSKDNRTVSDKLKTNIVEAIMAAIVLDSTYETGHKFFITYFEPILDRELDHSFSNFNVISKVINYFNSNKIKYLESKKETDMEGTTILTTASPSSIKVYELSFNFKNVDYTVTGSGINYKVAKNEAFSKALLLINK